MAHQTVSRLVVFLQAVPEPSAAALALAGLALEMARRVRARRL